MTRSEFLFDQYCKSQGYSSLAIEAGAELGKTADRFVETGKQEFIVEIKELNPTKDDLRKNTELQEQGFTWGGGRPGKRIQEIIRRAAPQLKRYEEKNIPCVLLIYDNLVIDGRRPFIKNRDLDPAFLDIAMYGLRSVVLDTNNLEFVGEARGGHRQLKEDQRSYISAITVLNDEGNGELFTDTYHNFFAKVKLPFNIFAGMEDKHYVKPGSPENGPHWIEVARDT